MCGTVRNKAFVTKDFPEDAVTTTEAINPTTIKNDDSVTTTLSKTEGTFCLDKKSKQPQMFEFYFVDDVSKEDELQYEEKCQSNQVDTSIFS